VGGPGEEGINSQAIMKPIKKTDMENIIHREKCLGNLKCMVLLLCPFFISAFQIDNLILWYRRNSIFFFNIQTIKKI
jgi:hypothetical protein